VTRETAIAVDIKTLES